MKIYFAGRVCADRCTNAIFWKMCIVAYLFNSSNPPYNNVYGMCVHKCTNAPFSILFEMMQISDTMHHFMN